MHRKTDTRLIRRIVLLCVIVMLVFLIVYLSISVCFTGGTTDNSTPDEAYISSTQTEPITIEPTVTVPTEPSTTISHTENVTVKPTEKVNKTQSKVTKNKRQNKKHKTTSKNKSSSNSYNYIPPAPKQPIYTPPKVYQPTTPKRTSSDINDEKIYDGEFID